MSLSFGILAAVGCSLIMECHQKRSLTCSVLIQINQLHVIVCMLSQLPSSSAQSTALVQSKCEEERSKHISSKSKSRSMEKERTSRQHEPVDSHPANVAVDTGDHESGMEIGAIQRMKVSNEKLALWSGPCALN